MYRKNFGPTIFTDVRNGFAVVYLQRSENPAKTAYGTYKETGLENHLYTWKFQTPPYSDDHVCGRTPGK